MGLGTHFSHKTIQAMCLCLEAQEIPFIYYVSNMNELWV